MSLEAQREKIGMFARLCDYELIAIVEDAGVSAKNTNRPGLNEVLGRLESGEAGALIVTNLDRLTRSVKDLGLMIESHFTRFSLVSVGEQTDTSTAVGRLVLNVLMSVAQWEREAISERTKTALQHKKAQGQRVGSIPHGSRLAGDGVTLEADQAEAEVVEAMKELDAAGPSLRAISQRLQKQGLSARSGGAFHPQTIANILKQQAAAASRLRRRPTPTNGPQRPKETRCPKL